MKNFFRVNFIVIVFAGIMSHVPAATAELERYDFPAIRLKPLTFSKPASLPEALPMPMPVPVPPKDALAKSAPAAASSAPGDRESVRKANEAKRKSIAALLQQYNKKLNDKQAYEYAILIIQASEKFRQDPFVIAAVVVNESSAKYDAVSRGGDYGLMQVRWRVHQKKIKKKYPHIAKAKDILNPKDNLLVGTEIFSVYRATANKDMRDTLMYYSAGNKDLTDKVLSVFAQLQESYRERLKNS